MKRLCIMLLSVILLLMTCTLFAQVVYTPNGTSVEAYAYSAGNVALFENQAAEYISLAGWTGLVTKTGNATSEYNCHSYAW